MASESLIRQAEKMYGSEFDTTDYAKLLTQPTVDVMTKNLEEQEKITDELINKMPAGISIDKIPEELRPMVTGWLTDNKAEYVKHAKVVGSGIASDDPRYLEALEGMNRIRSGFETLEADLAGLAENRKLSIEDRHKKSKYSHKWQQIDHESFANGTIYNSINTNGIGEGGKLSYTSNGEKKLVSDYGTFLTDGGGAAGVDALRKEVENRAQKGMDFDELGNSNMVTALVGQLGARGIGDLMYSNPMYIDEYIRLNHGGVTKETDEDKYKNIYEALKDKDLTEEFTKHLLGTKENPGMLRNTHTAAFRPYIPAGARTPKTDTDEYTIEDFKKVYHDTPFGRVSGSALAGDADRVKKIIAAGGNDKWYLGTSGNKYKLENDKWYIKEWNKNKKKYTKKYEASLQGVKDDLGIGAFDYLFFPGSAAASTAETSTILINPKVTKPSGTEWKTGQTDEKGQKITKPPQSLINQYGKDGIVWNSGAKRWIGVFRYEG